MAMRLVSTPTKITINAPGTTALGMLAASMAPGTWKKLDAGAQDAMLGVGPTSGSVLHYCNSMPWNPFRKCIEIVAMDHNAGMQRYVRYDEASNSFVLVRADDGNGTATRHGYDHNAVNPHTGDLYHRPALYGYESPTLYARKWGIGADATGFVDTPGTNILFYGQNAIGACYWSGAFAGAGSQGALLLYNSGDSAVGGSAQDGGIYAFDPLTSTWFWTSRGMSPFYGTGGSSYHSIIEYSAVKNVAVYGGGNDNPTKLWRLNSDRSFTAMPDTPSTVTVGIQQGVLCDDPVSGNYLLLSHGQLWELNPSGAGTWTQQTGSRSPPDGVGDPSAPHGVVCVSIPDHGVIAYITQTGASGGTFYLYKHAA